MLLAAAKHPNEHVLAVLHGVVRRRSSGTTRCLPADSAATTEFRPSSDTLPAAASDGSTAVAEAEPARGADREEQEEAQTDEIVAANESGRRNNIAPAHGSATLIKTKDAAVATEAVVDEPMIVRPRAVVPNLPRTFLGFTLTSICKTYIPLATSVFLAVNITFLGFSYDPPKSVLSLEPSCDIDRDHVDKIYRSLAVGFICSVCLGLASSLIKGSLEAREDARKRLQQPAAKLPSTSLHMIVCRIGVFLAAVCFAVTMLASIRGFILAVSVRMGKFPCWPGETKVLIVAALSMASMLSAYVVAAGLGAAVCAD